MCIAGGIALQLLEKEGIFIGAHIYSIMDVDDTPFDSLDVSPKLLSDIKEKDFPVISDDAGRQMMDMITQARKDADSLGGIIEGCATGLPAGIGGAMYDGLESFLAPIFFGIPRSKRSRIRSRIQSGKAQKALKTTMPFSTAKKK